MGGLGEELLTPAIDYTGPDGMKKYWTDEGKRLLKLMEIMQPGLQTRMHTQHYPGGSSVQAISYDMGDGLKSDSLIIKIVGGPREKEVAEEETRTKIVPCHEVINGDGTLAGFLICDENFNPIHFKPFPAGSAAITANLDSGDSSHYPPWTVGDPYPGYWFGYWDDYYTDWNERGNKEAFDPDCTFSWKGKKWKSKLLPEQNCQALYVDTELDGGSTWESNPPITADGGVTDCPNFFATVDFAACAESLFPDWVPITYHPTYAAGAFMAEIEDSVAWAAENGTGAGGAYHCPLLDTWNPLYMAAGWQVKYSPLYLQELRSSNLRQGIDAWYHEPYASEQEWPSGVELLTTGSRGGSGGRTYARYITDVGVGMAYDDFWGYTAMFNCCEKYWDQPDAVYYEFWDEATNSSQGPCCQYGPDNILRWQAVLTTTEYTGSSPGHTATFYAQGGDFWPNVTDIHEGSSLENPSQNVSDWITAYPTEAQWIASGDYDNYIYNYPDHDPYAGWSSTTIQHTFYTDSESFPIVTDTVYSNVWNPMRSRIYFNGNLPVYCYSWFYGSGAFNEARFLFGVGKADGSTKWIGRPQDSVQISMPEYTGGTVNADFGLCRIHNSKGELYTDANHPTGFISGGHFRAVKLKQVMGEEVKVIDD